MRKSKRNPTAVTKSKREYAGVWAIAHSGFGRSFNPIELFIPFFVLVDKVTKILCNHVCSAAANLGAQLTLLQPGRADYAHHITASPPGFEIPAASLDLDTVLAPL